ncbi:hypothetical protein AAHE18_09G128300 [Arachis hypogaea]
MFFLSPFETLVFQEVNNKSNKELLSLIATGPSKFYPKALSDHSCITRVTFKKVKEIINFETRIIYIIMHTLSSSKSATSSSTSSSLSPSDRTSSSSIGLKDK